MHEYSITESLLALALEKAKENQAAKIIRINVVLGELSGVVGECVQQYFEILGKDTPARGAVLNFDARPTTLKCRKCGKEFLPTGHLWDCPACHEASVEIVSGRECYMESIEVE